MAGRQAMLGVLLALHARVAVGRSLSLSDTVSAVQGLVQAHQHAESQTERKAAGQCADIPLNDEDEEQPLGASLAEEVEVVVVRGAGEDVRWLDAIPEIPTVLYDRNGLPELLPKVRKNLRIIAQDNTGREDDGMLRHIVSSYDRLPPFTLFLQGWPFWHCAGTLDMVRRALRNVRKPVDPDFIATGAQNGLAPVAATFYQYDVHDGYLGNWVNLVKGTRQTNKMSPQEIMAVAIRGYNATCAAVLNRPCPNRHWVSEGSQWAVSRERIRQTPLALYQRLLDMDIPGDDLHKTRLRGLVLEAAWPMLWGAPNWSPGDAVKTSSPGAHTSALRRTDSVGNYCVFSTDKGAYPTASERRGVCELEKHVSGPGGSYGVLAAEQAWEPVAALRAIQGHRISKDAVAAGSNIVQAPRPRKTYTSADVSPFCQKRHIWTVSMVTRLRNKESGRCAERSPTGFVMSECNEQAEVQQLHLNSKGNGGFYQIQDVTETNCFGHDFRTGGSVKCKMGADGGSADNQKWELLKQSDGVYQIKMKGAPLCLVHGAGLQKGACQGAAALWELTDAEAMGQYWKRFDFALTQFPDGKLALRCVMKLQSYKDAQASLDSVEPEWRRRGSMVQFRLVRADNGAYLLTQRLPTGGERYLSCDAKTKEAHFGETKAPWHIRPVSNGFVFLESASGALQFVVAGGKVRCASMKEGGVPPEDTTFALEFPHMNTRKI